MHTYLVPAPFSRRLGWFKVTNMSSIAQIPTKMQWQKLAILSLGLHALVLTVPLKKALEQRFFSPAADGLSVILQTRPAETLPVAKPIPVPAPQKRELEKTKFASEKPADTTATETSWAPREVSESDFKHYQHPLYPRIARLQGLQGVVHLAFWTSSDGHAVSRVEIQKSSGYPILDEAAVNAAKKWVFTKAIDPSVKLTKRVIFRLED